MTVGRRTQHFLLHTALLASSAFLLSPASHAQAAHAHGQARLEVLIDGPTVLIRLNAPQGDLLGFERAPRSDAERQAVDDLVARLRAAGPLFAIDPVANCKLGPVELRSPALGLGSAATPSAPAGTPASAGPANPAAATARGAESDAELDASFAFNCTNAVAAKYIDLGLFDAFKGMRQIEARISAPQGQFQRNLKRPTTRLAWNS